MNKDVIRRLLIEEQLHGALERGEFSAVYQPKFGIEDGKIMGAEALLRWYNPALGQVSPTEFIPVAEQTGVILTLGLFILDEALSLLEQRHQRDDIETIGVAVNLSPRQFRDPDLINTIQKRLECYSVQSKYLELEITEGVLLSGDSYIEDSMNKLSEMGVSIAMDDFGTGYSSLSYLRKFPFDIVKIDQSFIHDITDDSDDRGLVNAAIDMAHRLNLKVVAEGIETEEQLNYLKEMGCDYGQGYLFGKPMSNEEMSTFRCKLAIA